MTKARKIADLIGKLAASASIAEAEEMIQAILDEPDDIAESGVFIKVRPKNYDKRITALEKKLKALADWMKFEQTAKP